MITQRFFLQGKRALIISFACLSMLSLSACAPKKQSTPFTTGPEAKATATLIENAIKAYSEGRCEESVNQFSLALQQSQQTGIYNGLGMAYMQCRQPQSAIPVFEQAIRQNPGAAALHTNLATAYYESGQIDSAKKELRKALDLDPMYLAAVIGRAAIDIYEGKPEKALQELFALQSKNPDSLEIEYNLALAYHAMGLATDAEPLLQKYVKAHPQDADARNALATVLVDLGKFDEGKKELDEAIALYPVEASYYYNRGNTYRKLNKFEEAEDDYDRAIAFNPNMGEAYINRGDLRFLMREKDAACADLEKACSISGKFCERLELYEDTGRCPKGI